MGHGVGVQRTFPIERREGVEAFLDTDDIPICDGALDQSVAGISRTADKRGNLCGCEYRNRNVLENCYMTSYDRYAREQYFLD